MGHNPQALVSPEANAQLLAELDPAVGGPLLEQLITALHQALSMAIGQVFTIAMVVVLAALLATIFMTRKARPPERRPA